MFLNLVLFASLCLIFFGAKCKIKKSKNREVKKNGKMGASKGVGTKMYSGKEEKRPKEYRSEQLKMTINLGYGSSSSWFALAPKIK